MKHCENCGEDFYSETEFREHRQWEELKDNAKETARVFGAVSFGIAMTNMLLIARLRNLNIRDATQLYFQTFEEFGDAARDFNKGKQGKQ